MKQFWPALITLFLPFSCSQNGGLGVKNTIKSKSLDSTITKIQPLSKIVDEGQDCDYVNATVSLGAGLVIAPSQFELYNDSLLVSLFAKLNIYKMVESPNGLCPKIFEPEYGIMHFVCVGETSKSYQVLTGYSNINYFPKTKDCHFITWEDYILQSYGIRRHINEAGELVDDFPLRIKAMDGVDTIAIPHGLEMFCPMVVKGDWVKVKFDCLYNEENNPHEGQPCHEFIHKCDKAVTGWLQWRQGNKLLIDIFLMP